MIRPRATRLAAVAVAAGVTAVVVRWLRGPAAPVFTSAPSGPEPTGARSAGPAGTATTGGAATPPAAAAAEAAVEPGHVVDEPTDASEPSRRWAYPVDGGCPPNHPIKAKLRSGIYHLPGMMAYDRARPDRCYASPEDAEADGLRRAKR